MFEILCKMSGEEGLQKLSINDIEFGNVDEASISDCMCPYCNATATIVHALEKHWYASAHHNPDCPNVSVGKHKKTPIYTDVQNETFEEISEHRDHAPVKPAPKPDPNEDSEVEPKKTKEPVDEIDTIAEYKGKTNRTMGRIFSFIQANGLDSYVFNGKTGRDLLLNERNTARARRQGFSGDWIFVGHRCVPTFLNHPIDIPDGYILLKDAFTEDIEKALFVLVHIKNPDCNEAFRNKIMGPQEDRDKHRHILIGAHWQVYEHPYYKICYADISTDNYFFCNYVDIKD